MDSKAPWILSTFVCITMLLVVPQVIFTTSVRFRSICSGLQLCHVTSLGACYEFALHLVALVLFVYDWIVIG